MQTLIRPIGENEFLVINRLAQVQQVSDLLEQSGEKLRYVVAGLGEEEYAVFTPGEFIHDWQSISRQLGADAASKTIGDVPEFTSPRMATPASRLEGMVAVEGITLNQEEHRFVVLTGRRVTGLIIKRFKQQASALEILYQPVLLEELIEVGQDYKSGYGELQPVGAEGEIVVRHVDGTVTVVTDPQELRRYETYEASAEGRFYRRLKVD
ncbi:MAG TPA: hypothetical protein VJT09_18295, partial [Pyrinomonadaceae bacterium]|nr:hypothetical protein [Pyrinomonadaceae bacterium]